MIYGNEKIDNKFLQEFLEVLEKVINQVGDVGELGGMGKVMSDGETFAQTTFVTNLGLGEEEIYNVLAYHKEEGMLVISSDDRTHEKLLKFIRTLDYKIDEDGIVKMRPLVVGVAKEEEEGKEVQ